MATELSEIPKLRSELEAHRSVLSEMEIGQVAEEQDKSLVRVLDLVAIFETVGTPAARILRSFALHSLPPWIAGSTQDGI